MKKRALYRLISLAVGDADGEDVEFGRGNELPESAADQGDGSNPPEAGAVVLIPNPRHTCPAPLS